MLPGDRFTVQLAGLKLRIESGSNLVLFRSDGKNAYKSYKELKLSCPNSDQFGPWKTNLSLALGGGKLVRDITVMFRHACNDDYEFMAIFRI